ncbi:MAG: flippase-like domain-containing protein [Candidatus Omnitrophica bacterium]|nr:flippase-like domain-containing protein [Candidatus Omnitrophota bacterium]
MPTSLQFRLLKLLFLIVVFLFSIFYILQHQTEFMQIFRIGYKDLFTLFLLALSSLLLNGYLYNLFLRSFGIRMSFGEWFGLTVVHTYSNYIIIKSGIVARGLYLHKRYGFSYAKTAAIVTYISLIQIACAAMLCHAVTLRYHTAFSAQARTSFFDIALCAFLPFLVPLNLLSLFALKNAALKAFITEWGALRKHPYLWLPAVVSSILLVGLFAARISLLYNALFQPISFSSAIILSASGILSMFIAVTPGALGIREATMSLVTMLMGGAAVQTACVAAVDRAVMLLWIFFLGAVFTAKKTKNDSSSPTA